MRLLLISLWYYPEPVVKPHDLASELVRRGYDVTVLTGYPNYPSGRLFRGYRLHWRQWDNIDNVKVLRLPFFFDRSHSGMRRILSLISFSLSIFLLGSIFTNRKFDAIWTYQIGLPGVMLSKLFHIPLIHEVQDLWPEWSRSGSMRMNNWLYTILDREEQIIYNYAYHIITISTGFKKTLIEKGVAADKITVLPNWANEQECDGAVVNQALARRDGLLGNFNVIYAGNLGTAQALDAVLKAAKMLADLVYIKFIFIGDGVERKKLEEKAQALDISNVLFLGSRPFEQIKMYLAFADVLLIHLKGDPAYQITIPSKTYTYLASGKPILVAATGEVEQLISSIGAGIACKPGHPLEISMAIRRLFTMPLEKRIAMGIAGRQAYESYFAASTIVSKYETIFQNIRL